MSAGRPARFSTRYWLRLAGFAAALLAVAGLALLAGLLARQVDLLVTPRRAPVTATPAGMGLPFTDVTLTTADGLHLSGWYIPGTRPYGVVLAHGLNTNRAAMLPEAAILAGAGYHLLLVDLRGHGLSDDSVVSYGYREALDVQAAADYLLALPEVKSVGAAGISMGAAAVVRAAALDPRLSPLVIESSYSSLPAAIQDAFDDFTLLPRPFARLVVALAERRTGITAGQVNSVRDLALMSPRPVLIIHYRYDRLFPPEHARQMYAAARGPKQLWLFEGDLPANPVTGREAEYQARVIPFFEAAFAN